MLTDISNRRKMHLLMFVMVADSEHRRHGFTMEWISSFAKNCKRVDVITMLKGKTPLPSNVNVYSVGKEKGYSEARRIFEFYRCLFKILKKEVPDACFSHMIPIFTILGAPLLRKKRIPIITWYAHLNLSNTLKAAHHLSNLMVSSFSSTYPYRKDKLVVVGQGIDTKHFSHLTIKVEESVPRILCAGRLSSIKNLETLIEAAAIMKKKSGPYFRVILLGSPATDEDILYRSALKSKIFDLDLQDIVFINPSVSIFELPNCYRNCTVHVNLTPYGSGDKVVLEAMSCEKPSLASNEIFRDVMGPYADKLIFREKDSEDLAGKLHVLLNEDSIVLNEIGKYLRAQVVKHHSMHRLTNRLIDLMKCLKNEQ